MFPCEDLFQSFKNNDLTFFTGVPDSTFKEWMSFLDEEHGKKLTNIIACNECEAVALAAGYHLSTKKIGVVYLQNSGEGKTVNPLTSLCDPEVYSIPEILMIGWRGRPGEKDEPQHKKMGKITLGLLDLLDIPYVILSDQLKTAEKQIEEVKALAINKKGPAAIIINSGLFEPFKSKRQEESSLEMSREDAIKIILDSLSGKEVIISTTGKTSRELFEYRVTKKEEPRDFYTVGSMGCASSIANAIAMQKPNKEILVFDGDGAAIMQLGSLTTIGHYKPKNLFHIIFDNQSYDSTGEQPTVSESVDFCGLALSCGYTFAKNISSAEELKKEIRLLKGSTGPGMLVIKVKKGSRKGLGRPTKSPVENKESFMEYLNQ
jgi:phosphonopyruvate decarboxylase